MTPPPEDERMGHETLQGETIRDLGKDYKEYQKELREKFLKEGKYDGYNKT